MYKIAKFILKITSFLPESYTFIIGSFSKKWRYYWTKKMAKRIGRNVNIEKGAMVYYDTVIGDDSGIGINCKIPPRVTIGSRVLIAPDCKFFTHGHKFDKKAKRYVGNTEYREVIVEDDVWIGSNTLILPGVTIGRGSTVGAGSVVVKDVPPYSLVAGNPAIVKKSMLD